MVAIPRGATAVMARRVEAPDSLDYFPTPPWATRGFCEHVLCRYAGPPGSSAMRSCWEPACGAGHMAAVLAEYFERVHASDIHDYSDVGAAQDRVTDFLGPEPRSACLRANGVDWIITNPPFRLAVEFVETALPLARHGVAMLVRSVWAEGADRHARLFDKQPPTAIAQYVERVPMTKGRWDPAASTATSYAWFLWRKGVGPLGTRFLWIPKSRKALTKADDAMRFGAVSAAPLLDGEGAE